MKENTMATNFEPHEFVILVQSTKIKPSTVLFRSNLGVRSYWPDADFGYINTVTLTLEMVQIMKHESWTTIVLNIIPIRHDTVTVWIYGLDMDFDYVFVLPYSSFSFKVV